MSRLIFIILFLACLSYADPFYSNDRNENQTALSTKNTEFDAGLDTEKMLCTPTNDPFEVISIHQDFSQLKFVGISKINQQFKALFLNNDNQLFSFRENDFLKTSNIQIKKIDFKHVHYIDWQQTQDCHHPNEIILTL